jgi:DTW domain-containing protein YfiP
MRCIECHAAEVSERPERTARGCQRFRCHACDGVARTCGCDWLPRHGRRKVIPLALLHVSGADLGAV